MTSTNTISLADRIRQLAEEEGLSSGDLGKIVGRSQQTVSGWMNDVSEPTRGPMEKMAGLAGVPVGVFEHGSDIEYELVRKGTLGGFDPVMFTEIATRAVAEWCEENDVTLKSRALSNTVGRAFTRLLRQLKESPHLDPKEVFTELKKEIPELLDRPDFLEK